MVVGEALACDVPVARAVGGAVAALLIGSALPAVGPRADAIPAAAGGLVAATWVLGRLIVMRVQAPASDVRPDQATIAWASGALFFAVAVSPLLRATAWLAGAIVTYRTLRGAGIAPSRAGRLVAWGYGFEAAGVVAVWLLRSAAITAYFAG